MGATHHCSCSDEYSQAPTITSTPPNCHHVTTIELPPRVR